MQLHISRIFDNKRWFGYEEFNRNYRKKPFTQIVEVSYAPTPKPLTIQTPVLYERTSQNNRLSRKLLKFFGLDNPKHSDKNDIFR